MHVDIPVRGVRTFILGKGTLPEDESFQACVLGTTLKKETVKETVMDEKLTDIHHFQHGPINAGGWMFHP